MRLYSPITTSQFLELVVTLPPKIAALILAGEGYNTSQQESDKCHTIVPWIFLLAITSISFSLPLPTGGLTSMVLPRTDRQLVVQMNNFLPGAFYSNLIVWILAQSALNVPGDCPQDTLHALHIARFFCIYFFLEGLLTLLYKYLYSLTDFTTTRHQETV